MNERNRASAGTLVAGVLAAGSLLQAYWATGGVFPAKDKESLTRIVLNTDPFRPAIVAPLAGPLFSRSGRT